ncbi:hypothetical protein HOY34_14435 [Xinfangfangia sp. D13-10-4-6]|uniref:hypothetical protein n=1 Tax=Pseudogemmobacter hezensis TaxID=2737662 RepID=UPI001552865B|nr:hypothetical protein [Pseudogemmobacter hezensis]NPD16394.1 hypothetical protein [Pseudogemmobacter hezensis]
MSTEKDPLDALSRLSLPAADPARMRADIALARARFASAGLPGAAHAPAGQVKTGLLGWLRDRIGLVSTGLIGSLSVAGLAAIAFLPERAGRGESLLAESDQPPLAPIAPAPADVSVLAGAPPAPPAPPARPAAPVTAAPPVTAIASAEAPSSPVQSEVGQSEVASPIQPAPLDDSLSRFAAAKPERSAPASGSDSFGAADIQASGAERISGTTLPRIGGQPGLRPPDLNRDLNRDPAQVSLRLPAPDAVFSGGLGFTFSGDESGFWLERDSGNLRIPTDAVAPGTRFDMTRMFVLKPRQDLPAFFVIMGVADGVDAWQIFRIGDDEILYDSTLTRLLKDAVTPGQVEGMLTQLPAAN